MIQDFLFTKECEDLILFSKNIGYEEAKVRLKEGEKMLKGIPNNSRLLYEDEHLAQQYLD